MVKEIKLTQGKVAFVDDEDYELVSQFKWQVLKDKKKRTYYAIRSIHLGMTKEKKRIRKTQSMHRLIFNASKGVQVDHKDNDGLNNQKDNLRSATHSQNQINSEKYRTNKGRVPASQYKGIHYRKDCKKWRAEIQVNKKRVHLGHFEIEIEAAKAYDIAAMKYFGEFAKLNFPKDIYNAVA